MRGVGQVMARMGTHRIARVVSWGNGDVGPVVVTKGISSRRHSWTVFLLALHHSQRDSPTGLCEWGVASDSDTRRDCIEE